LLAPWLSAILTASASFIRKNLVVPDFLKLNAVFQNLFVLLESPYRHAELGEVFHHINVINSLPARCPEPSRDLLGGSQTDSWTV